jgi:hypothetical protein
MDFSRRSLLKSLGVGAAFAVSGLGSGIARAQSTPKKRAVVHLFLNAGYNALFASADAFMAKNYFGVTGTNSLQLQNGLVIDKAFGDGIGAYARDHLATIGIRHGSTDHAESQTGYWMGGSSKSAVLQLAQAMPAYGPIRAANVGVGAIRGVHDELNGVTLQRIANLKNTIDTLKGNGALEPRRALGLKGAVEAQMMSREAQSRNPSNLRSDIEGRIALKDTLTAAPSAVDLATIPAAYGVTAFDIAASKDYAASFAAAEIMIRAGTSVVVMPRVGDTALVTNAWDTHGDVDGSDVRAQMAALVLKPLQTFVNRMMADAALAGDHEVYLVISGDFARSLPGSDHAPITAASIIGPRIKNASTGRVTATEAVDGSGNPVFDAQGRRRVDLSLPQNTGSWAGVWSLLGELMGAQDSKAMFGTNPHKSVIRG